MKAMVPLSVRLPTGVICSVTAPVTSVRRDHRRIVGAGDGDVDGAGDSAAVAVVERDGEGLDLGLARRQILDRRVRNAVVPGDTPPVPVPVVSVVTLAVSVPSAPADGVAGLMLCASVRSTSVNAMVPLSVRLPDRGDQLGHRAGHIRGRDHRRIVGAGDGDVTWCVTVPPLPSSSVKVKVSTLVWPAARYSTA